MGEEKQYLGIPRRLIPWYPGIDPDGCTGCGLCVTACKHGVYAFDDAEGKAVVANPYECEVYCQSCQFQCEPKRSRSLTRARSKCSSRSCARTTRRVRILWPGR